MLSCTVDAGIHTKVNDDKSASVKVDCSLVVMILDTDL